MSDLHTYPSINDEIDDIIGPLPTQVTFFINLFVFELILLFLTFLLELFFFLFDEHGTDTIFHIRILPVALILGYVGWSAIQNRQVHGPYIFGIGYFITALGMANNAISLFTYEYASSEQLWTEPEYPFNIVAPFILAYGSFVFLKSSTRQYFSNPIPWR
jgi:hypothetical protein